MVVCGVLTLRDFRLVQGGLTLHGVGLAEHVVGHDLLKASLAVAVRVSRLVLGRVDHGVLAELALLVKEVGRLVLGTLHFLGDLLETGQSRMMLA